MDEVKDLAVFWFMWISLGLFIHASLVFLQPPDDDDDFDF